MWNNIVGQHIRRTNRNLIVWNVLLLILLLLIAAASSRYYANFFQGPYAISQERLAALQNPDDAYRNYIRITPDRITDSGGKEVYQTQDKYSGKVESERVTSHYLLCDVGDRVLLVKSGSEDEHQREFIGTLTPIPTEVQNEIINPTWNEAPELRTRMLPYMMEEGKYEFAPQFGLVVGGLLFLMAAWNLLNAVKRSNPMEHPIAKGLAAYGNPLDIANTMDREASLQAFQSGGVMLTQNWLLMPSTFGLMVWPLDQLVWIYKKVTQHRTNGVPTGKTFTAVLCPRNGLSKEIQTQDQNVDQILHEILQRRPYLFVGFGDQIAQAWRTDKAGLIAALDRRKWQMEHPEPPAAPAEASPEPVAPSEPTFDL
ncbi:MAG TPA: DUF6709 family protein [Chthonomonadaceae bacterium]|nr:DUF6709 family protein [Chthonomonadaceae bacterium]